MGAFIEFCKLNETRRNPEMNPKVSAYEYLKPYKDDSNIYISFTMLDKLGINPSSSYSSPNGIYCYPIKECWKYYQIDRHKTLAGILPYSSRNPYIWILKNESSDFVEDMFTTYNNNNYDKDIKILRSIVIDASHDNKRQLLKNFNRLVLDLNNIPDKVDQFQEKYLHLITENIIDKFKKLFKSKETFGGELFDAMQTLALANRKENNSIGTFWSLTELIAKLIGTPTNKQRTSIKWNSILRKCGYSGFADKSGQGLIYPTEPIQAVFLSRNSCTVIDKILNKDY